MDRSSVEAWSIYSVFCAVYLGQALWAHFRAPDLWIGRALGFLNQWIGVVELGALCGALAGLVKMLWFSEGHLGNSISGLAWSGPPSHSGKVFGAVFALALIAFGYLLVRAPPRSTVASVALFLGPGVTASVATVGWIVLLLGRR